MVPVPVATHGDLSPGALVPGGYFQIETAILDDAQAWAAKLPAAGAGAVAIRAIERPAIPPNGRRAIIERACWPCWPVGCAIWPRPGMNCPRRSAQRWPTWPRSGIPDRPEAWLITAAKRAAGAARVRTATEIAALPTLMLLSDKEQAMPAGFPDHRLGLMIACTHADL